MTGQWRLISAWKSRLMLCVIASFASACVSSDLSVQPNPAKPEFHIHDAEHNAGNLHFFFLPPMVSQPAFSGTFDGSLEPTVDICEWTGEACVLPLLAQFTTTGPGSETVQVVPTEELYTVNWHTNQFSLDPAKSYRIRVVVAGAELGHADVDVVASGRELKNVNTGEYIPLEDGRTLPIKFRIEQGAVFVVGPSGAAITAAGGNVSLTVPEDAVEGTIGLTLQGASNVPPDAGLVTATAFDFGPTGTTFAQPVTVTIAYLPANIPAGVEEGSLRLHTLVGDQWELVPGSTVNTDNNTVSGSVSHFSVFAAVSAAASGGPFAYVANSGSGTVSVIQTSTNEVVATVDVGGAPSRVAITPDGALAYVTNGSYVSVIETATNTVVATVVEVNGVGSGNNVAITPDGAFAYVVGQSTVFVIATATNSVVTTIEVGLGARGVAVTPDGAYAYVAADNAVLVIATVTNTVVATVALTGPTATALVFTPDGAFAYVVGEGMWVIATATHQLVASIGAAANAFGAAITPDGDFVYVADNDSERVPKVATATNTLVAQLSTGLQCPIDVALTPDGAFAYVVTQCSVPGRVLVFDTTTDALVTTVDVGSFPRGVAMTP